MPVGNALAFTKTMTTGLTAATFNVYGAYDSYVVHIPSMASGGDLSFCVAPSDSGTFRPLYIAQSLTSAPVAVSIASSISNCAIPVYGLGQHFEIHLSTATTASAYEFTVVCGSN